MHAWNYKHSASTILFFTDTYGQFCAGPAPYTAWQSIRTGARRTNSAKRNRASSSKKKGTIPTSGTNKDRFKLIFPSVNSVQSPFKKRIQIMKQSVTILEDEKSDDLSEKDTVEPHKKCLTIQSKHTKQSKPQTAFYWKYLMQYFENACSGTLDKELDLFCVVFSGNLIKICCDCIAETERNELVELCYKR
eukprot:725156_1